MEEKKRATDQYVFHMTTKSKLGKVVSKPDLDMSRLSQNENREISKLMTH